MKAKTRIWRRNFWEILHFVILVALPQLANRINLLIN